MAKITDEYKIPRAELIDTDIETMDAIEDLTKKVASIPGVELEIVSVPALDEFVVYISKEDS